MHIFRKLTKAAAIFSRMEAIISVMDCAGIHNVKLLSTKPDYTKITLNQYSTLIATAFRLTISIEQKTDLIENYYKKLKISGKQKLIVVGSLLMRLTRHLLNNTFDFEYSYPFGKNVHSFLRVCYYI